MHITIYEKKKIRRQKQPKICNKRKLTIYTYNFSQLQNKTKREKKWAVDIIANRNLHKKTIRHYTKEIKR